MINKKVISLSLFDSFGTTRLFKLISHQALYDDVFLSDRFFTSLLKSDHQIEETIYKS